jgi:hypothetical protein
MLSRNTVSNDNETPAEPAPVLCKLRTVLTLMAPVDECTAWARHAAAANGFGDAGIIDTIDTDAKSGAGS